MKKLLLLVLLTGCCTPKPKPDPCVVLYNAILEKEAKVKREQFIEACRKHPAPYVGPVIQSID